MWVEGFNENIKVVNKEIEKYRNEMCFLIWLISGKNKSTPTIDPYRIPLEITIGLKNIIA